MNLLKKNAVKGASLLFVLVSAPSVFAGAYSETLYNAIKGDESTVTDKAGAVTKLKSFGGYVCQKLATGYTCAGSMEKDDYNTINAYYDALNVAPLDISSDSQAEAPSLVIVRASRKIAGWIVCDNAVVVGTDADGAVANQNLYRCFFGNDAVAIQTPVAATTEQPASTGN